MTTRCLEGGMTYLVSGKYLRFEYGEAAAAGSIVPCSHCGKKVKLRYSLSGMTYLMVPNHNKPEESKQS